MLCLSNNLEPGLTLLRSREEVLAAMLRYCWAYEVCHSKGWYAVAGLGDYFNNPNFKRCCSSVSGFVQRYCRARTVCHTLEGSTMVGSGEYSNNPNCKVSHSLVSGIWPHRNDGKAVYKFLHGFDSLQYFFLV